MKIALLTDLFERIGPDNVSDLGIFTFELARGLQVFAEELGGIEVDLVAKRESWQKAGLISIDLEQLPGSPTTEFDRFSRQEAAYCQLILSGLLDDYDLVHCLAALVGPLQLLAAMKIPILQTVVTNANHPSYQFPPALINVNSLLRTSPNSFMAHNGNMRHIPSIVDLQTFTISPKRKPNHILWLADDNDKNAGLAKDIAKKLALPLRVGVKKNVVKELQNAAFLLDLSVKPSVVGDQWALRALACGVPIIKWLGSSLDELLEPPQMGVAVPHGEVELLMKKANGIPHTSEASSLRRQMILALHGSRSIVKQYLECYEKLLGLR